MLSRRFSSNPSSKKITTRVHCWARVLH